MLINGKEVDINSLVKQQSKSFYTRCKNGILLTSDQRVILTKYKIKYDECHNLEELLFKIEECLNDLVGYNKDDLENVSLELSEIYYYNDVNK